MTSCRNVAAGDELTTEARRHGEEIPAECSSVSNPSLALASRSMESPHLHSPLFSVPPCLRGRIPTLSSQEAPQ
jgi:hypothetical protein